MLLQQVRDGFSCGGLSNVIGKSEIPGSDPEYVAVYNGQGMAVRNAHDGGTDVVTHPGQLSECCGVIRNQATILRHDHAGGLVQVPGPAIVPQPLPQLQHILLVGVRQ